MHNVIPVGIVGRLFFPQQAVEFYSIPTLDLELKDLLTRVELEVNSRGIVAISDCLLLRKLQWEPYSAIFFTRP